jgi:hypothetical protein
MFKSIEKQFFFRYRKFIVTGSNILSFQGKYSVAVASFGYPTEQRLEVNLYGKLENGTRRDNRKSVTLKNSGVQFIEFDVS